MKTRHNSFIRTATTFSAAVALAAGLAACDVDQVQEAKAPDVDVDAKAGQLPKYEVTKVEEGKLPDVDVKVEGGQLPKFEVETADVKVGTKTVEVKVPDVDVVMPDEKDKGTGG